MSNLLIYTALLMTLLTLLIPLMMPATTLNIINNSMKLATLITTIPLLVATSTGIQATTTNMTWATTQFNLEISITLDQYSMTFLPVALFITHTILQFTIWYMSSDPKQMKFSKYLMLFLLMMLLFTTANNMLQLFVGWEGIGIMSFMLISWWHARAHATTAALQAVLYNRVGDIGLILAMAWMAMDLNTWDLQQMFTNTTMNIIPLLGLILAAIGKSAQFGLHPWLPAAMEGPTPVSALLHSSTMVVAGVFLLIRLHPLMATNKTALLICLCLGAISTIFAALCALTQNDIKKIIAYSTSSQLGLMMLTLGMNQPELAFLHILTHAFFKALLFLTSGSVIHSLNNEQDIRKMGGLQKLLPTTTACMTMGSLALMGTPYLAGFYTKDLIIETMNMSPLNAWSITMALLATTLTAAYSLRLIFYTQMRTPRYNPVLPPMETSPHQIKPLLHLSIGSITAGLVLSMLTPPMKPQMMTLPMMIKLAALMVTLLGLVYTLDLMMHTAHLHTPTNPKMQTMTTHVGFFTMIYHRHLPKTSLYFSQKFSIQLKDLSWYETVVPMSIKTMNTTLTKMISSTHTGHIKNYLMTTAALLGSTIIFHYYGAR